jgi:predicted RNA-binding protein YlqC (UPF0109 family)
MLKSTANPNLPHRTSPDYINLIGFLLKPMLESPDSLKIDCEKVNSNQRVWIRLAIDELDKGRVYGRGGRNIQAIQTVLTIAANKAGESLYLDVYEGFGDSTRSSSPQRPDSNRKFVRRRSRAQGSNVPKLTIRSRWQEE